MRKRRPTDCHRLRSEACLVQSPSTTALYCLFFLLPWPQSCNLSHPKKEVETCLFLNIRKVMPGQVKAWGPSPWLFHLHFVMIITVVLDNIHNSSNPFYSWAINRDLSFPIHKMGDLILEALPVLHSNSLVKVVTYICKAFCSFPKHRYMYCLV